MTLIYKTIIYLRFEGKLVKVDSSDNDRKGNEGKVFQNISYDYSTDYRPVLYIVNSTLNSVLLHNELVFKKFRIYEGTRGFNYINYSRA